MKHYMIFAFAFFLWTCLNLYLRRIKRQKVIQKEKILNIEGLKLNSGSKQNQNTMFLKKATVKNLKVLVLGVIFLWSCFMFYDLYKDFSWKDNIDKIKWIMFNVKINLSTGINI